MPDERKESIYCGNAIRKRGRDNDYIKVQLDLTIIDQHRKQYGKSVKFKDGAHELMTVIVSPMRTENCTEYKDHTVKVDTWIPDPNYRKGNQTPARQSDRLPDDLPNAGGGPEEEMPF